MSAIIHQNEIVEVIRAVFSLPDVQFEAVFRGGSPVVNKLIRSYHYWFGEYVNPITGVIGICPYDYPELGFFRMTPGAAEVVNNWRNGHINREELHKQIHCEHTVPVDVLINELRARRGVVGFAVDAVQYIMDANEIVIVTQDERRRLDRRHRAVMPQGWVLGHSHLARLTHVLEINIEDLIGHREIGLSGHEFRYPNVA